jgi:hypothetical protein
MHTREVAAGAAPLPGRSPRHALSRDSPPALLPELCREGPRTYAVVPTEAVPSLLSVLLWVIHARQRWKWPRASYAIGRRTRSRAGVCGAPAAAQIYPEVGLAPWPTALGRRRAVARGIGVWGDIQIGLEMGARWSRDPAADGPATETRQGPRCTPGKEL